MSVRVSTRKRWAGAAAVVLAVALLSFGMRMLAAGIVAGQLQRTADQQLARVETGQPLWQWPLREPRDLVAGRAFGAASIRRVPGGLRIASRDGTPFEIGLPVRRWIDAGDWPLLTLQGNASAPFRLGVSWQPQLGQPMACVAWLDTPVASGTMHVVVDLRRLHWQSIDGADCAAMHRIDVLRLKFHLPARTWMQLDRVSLHATQPMPVPTAAALRLSTDTAIAARQLATANLPRMPWIALPARASAETQLDLRERVWQRWPAALVVTGDTVPVPHDGGATPAWLAWFGALGYLLALIGLAWRQPAQPARRWLELMACLGGPLWLTIGLQLGLHLTMPSLLAFGGALMFAAHAEWRGGRANDWRWLGQPRDWLPPFALLPVALLLIVMAGGSFTAPLASHVVVYLVWASLQQWLILVVALRRLEAARLPVPAVILATATLFALMHTPNGVLMQLCLLAELWWAWCFRRSRALLPIAAAHAACALLLEAGLAGGWLRSLEVSARFFL